MAEGFTPVNEPAWLTAAVDQVIAKAEAHGAFDVAREGNYAVVSLFLVDLPEDPADVPAWENSCDRCGKVVSDLVAGSSERVRDGIQVNVTFGVCQECLTTFPA